MTTTSLFRTPVVKICLAILSLLPVCSNTYSQVPAEKNIGQRTFQFRDQRRERPVVTELWYPTEDSLRNDDKVFSPFVRSYTVRNGSLPGRKMPLLLLSHGTGGGRLTLEWLAQGLVRCGFMVAAVDHWGNTHENKIPIEFVKPWERPQDISFALTSLLGETGIGNIIDTNRVGAIGFSFGGYTVIALAGGEADLPGLIRFYRSEEGRKEFDVAEFPGLAYLLEDSALNKAARNVPPLKDKRMRAFFSISPSVGRGFTDQSQVRNITDPLYIVGTHSDSASPVKINAHVYRRLIPHARYFEFPGKTGHYVMLSEAIEEVRKSAPVFFEDDPAVNRAEVHKKVVELACPFFKEHL